MAVVTLKNATKNTMLDSIDATFNSGTLEIRSGSAPGAGNAATGTVLATIALPADAFAAASAGSKAKSGTWSDVSADATGTAAHFRFFDAGSTNVIEGDITATGGGGAMTLDSVSVTSGQTVTITSLSLTL